MGLTSFYFYSEDLKQMVGIGLLIFLLSVAILADVSVMPAVWLTRLYVAQNMMYIGLSYHQSGEINFLRNMLVRHPSPTPLAAHFYQIPIFFFSAWNIYMILYTLLPGCFVFCLPDVFGLQMFRNTAVKCHVSLKL